MTTIQKRCYEMLVRVRDFADTNREHLPSSDVFERAYGDVSHAADKIHRLSFETARRNVRDTRAKTAARAALVARLMLFRRTALAMEAMTPGVSDAFPNPRRYTDGELALIGSAAIDAAASYRDAMVAFGMPAACIEQLADLVKGFEKAMQSCSARRTAQWLAGNSLERALASGLAAARQMDAMVHNCAIDDLELLTVWRFARRIDYPHRPLPRSLMAPAAPVLKLKPAA